MPSNHPNNKAHKLINPQKPESPLPYPLRIRDFVPNQRKQGVSGIFD